MSTTNITHEIQTKHSLTVDTVGDKVELRDRDPKRADPRKIEYDVAGVFSVALDTEGEVADPLAHHVIRENNCLDADCRSSNIVPKRRK